MQQEENQQVKTGVLTRGEIKPSARCARVRYAIRDVVVVAEQARKAGKQLISLNIGDPLLYDFPTPPHLIEAIYQAMLSGRNGYAPVARDRRSRRGDPRRGRAAGNPEHSGSLCHFRS